MPIFTIACFMLNGLYLCLSARRVNQLLHKGWVKNVKHPQQDTNRRDSTIRYVQDINRRDSSKDIFRLIDSTPPLFRSKRIRHLGFFDIFVLELENSTEKVKLFTFFLLAAICLAATVRPSLAVVIHLAFDRIKSNDTF